jgi:hypothetical protein
VLSAHWAIRQAMDIEAIFRPSSAGCGGGAGDGIHRQRHRCCRRHPLGVSRLAGLAPGMGRFFDVVGNAAGTCHLATCASMVRTYGWMLCYGGDDIRMVQLSTLYSWATIDAEAICHSRGARCSVRFSWLVSGCVVLFVKRQCCQQEVVVFGWVRVHVETGAG